MVLTDHEKSRDQQPGYQENKRHQQHDGHRRHWHYNHIRTHQALNMRPPVPETLLKNGP